MKYKSIILFSVGIALIAIENADANCPQSLTYEEWKGLEAGETLTIGDQKYKKDYHFTSHDFKMDKFAGPLPWDESFFNWEVCIYGKFKEKNHFGIRRFKP
jgi:hypothetical protein